MLPKSTTISHKKTSTSLQIEYLGSHITTMKSSGIFLSSYLAILKIASTNKSNQPSNILSTLNNIKIPSKKSNSILFSQMS